MWHIAWKKIAVQPACYKYLDIRNHNYPQLMVLNRRPSQHHRPMSISPVLSQSPSTKWSLRSACYLTRAVLLIHYRLQHWSLSSMFSRLFDWTIQSFTYNRLRLSRFQECVHLISSEKSRSGFIGFAILQSNHQSISRFEATWKTHCSPTPCPSQLKRSTTKIPVGVSISPLNGDRCAEGLDGHSSCSRRRRSVCPCSVGPIGGLGYGRSWYSSASTGLFLSDHGISTTMVSVLPVKPATTRASRIFLFVTLLYGVWRTPGFSPWCHTFPSVLWWPAADHWEPRTLPASVCWWLMNPVVHQHTRSCYHASQRALIMSLSGCVQIAYN